MCEPPEKPQFPPILGETGHELDLEYASVARRRAARNAREVGFCHLLNEDRVVDRRVAPVTEGDSTNRVRHPCAGHVENARVAPWLSVALSSPSAQERTAYRTAASPLPDLLTSFRALLGSRTSGERSW